MPPARSPSTPPGQGEELTTAEAQRHTGHPDRRQERGRELAGLQRDRGLTAEPALTRAHDHARRHYAAAYVGWVSIELTWRGPFENGELNALHAAAFETRVYSDEEWNWRELVERHSLGWVVARDHVGLAGFANVVWDGLVHAWIQDVMVDDRVGRQGVGRAIVARVRGGRSSGWLRDPARRLRGRSRRLLHRRMRLHTGEGRSAVTSPRDDHDDRAGPVCEPGVGIEPTTS